MDTPIKTFQVWWRDGSMLLVNATSHDNAVQVAYALCPKDQREMNPVWQTVEVTN